MFTINCIGTKYFTKKEHQLLGVKNIYLCIYLCLKGQLGKRESTTFKLKIYKGFRNG